MPNRSSHAAIGVAAALFAGRDWLSRVPSIGQAGFLAGLALGGASGGVAPDVIEPAEHPHHRDTFHSLAAMAVILWLMRDRVPEVSEANLRAAAELNGRRTSASCPEPDRLWLALQEQLCYVAAGALQGLAAGYASHVLADALTPRAVPLLARRLV